LDGTGGNKLGSAKAAKIERGILFLSEKAVSMEKKEYEKEKTQCLEKDISGKT